METEARNPRVLHIGFVSTRFQGLDGVSLETTKWVSLLERFHHRCYWFAGELDTDPERSLLVPEAYFRHPAILALERDLFGNSTRSREVTDTLHRMKEYLKNRLYEFVERFGLDLLVAENALAIPVHLPLGMALTELIAETGIPTIGHHHDFYWERPRFLLNSVKDILDMAFPPDLPSIRHVVINSRAQRDLAGHRSISSQLIYNVIDFEREEGGLDDFNREFRADLGFAAEDLLILQPTRVVSRKGIEQAIYLAEMLGLPGVKLLISHSHADEGVEYLEWIKESARRQEVPLYLIQNRLHDSRRFTSGGKKLYSLWDVYPHMDLITYPSLYEGFGNAFLEAVYFRKPLMVNRYEVYIMDIEPKGFDVIAIDGFLTPRAVQEVRQVLQDADRRRAMVEKNYELARKHFSFQSLRRGLNILLTGFFGASTALSQDTTATGG
ncbi:MAG TPA: glycosyltransferase family 4 protein [Anaerolineales bacterium]|nr:glycosyltransferase family 4 protein [Anaerolineales bacterium]